jgi:hypothetical protein
MARCSLFSPFAMRKTGAPERGCSYVVLAENATGATGELGELAKYLSTLGVAGCEVIILDPSSRPQFEVNGRVLRWVGRHVRVRPEFRALDGAADVVRAAAALASCEKVIVAAEDVRYTPQAISRICALLETHEVVEPQDYLEPMPWWSGLEAGRILVHRGIEPEPDHGATFGFRRSAVRALRGLSVSAETQARRLAVAGAEVHCAADVFVRREPGALSDWLAARPRIAGDDFTFPVKTAFFLAILPLLILFAVAGGLGLAGGYAGVIAFAAIGLAVRGRAGAASVFPLRACLFAPLWILERSLSVYWALFRKLRGAGSENFRVAGSELRDETYSQRVTRNS